MATHRNALKSGHKLHWYEIESILGQGGFGITYLARDPNLDQLVAIKEFLPIELAVREQDSSLHPVSDGHSDTYGWGLNRFLSEAQTLARFRHPNIVRVLSVFESNNTAYMVMEYEQGKSLEHALKFRHIEGEQALLGILLPLLDGLSLVHEAGFIHRDIKPDNIFLRETGVPVLLDFGSARQALGVATRTLTTLVSPGFAPFEQYNASREADRQGPWTDIYSLGATMYRAVSGRGPPDALVRANAALEGLGDPLTPALEIAADQYSHEFLHAIDAALTFLPEKRPQSVQEWLEMLPASTTGESVSGRIMQPVSAAEAERETLLSATPEATPEPGLEQPSAVVRQDLEVANLESVAQGGTVKSRRRTGPAALALLLLVGVAVAAWFSVKRAIVDEGEPVVQTIPGTGVSDAGAAAPADEGNVSPAHDVKLGVVDAAEDVFDEQTSDELSRQLLKLAKERSSNGSQEMGSATTLEPVEPAHGASSAVNQVGATLPEAEPQISGSVSAELADNEQESESGRQRIEEEIARASEEARLAETEAENEAETEAEAQRRAEVEKAQAEQAQAQRLAEIEQARLAEEESLRQLEAERLQAEREEELRLAGSERDAELAKQQDIEQLLVLATADLQASRLTTPAGNNALERYQSVLEIDQGNATALAGLDQIVRSYVSLAQRAAAKSQFDKARRYLDRGETVLPDSQLALEARVEVDQAEQAQREAERVAAEEALARQREAEEQRGEQQALAAERREVELEQEKARLSAELEQQQAEFALRQQLEAAAAQSTGQTSGAASNDARMALFPVDTFGACFSAIKRQSIAFISKLIGEEKRTSLAFTYYKDGATGSGLSDVEALWSGSRGNKKPNLERVYAQSERLNADAVVMANIKCSHQGTAAEAFEPFQIWIIDAKGREVYHAKDRNSNFNQVTRDVFALYLSAQ